MRGSEQLNARLLQILTSASPAASQYEDVAHTSGLSQLTSAEDSTALQKHLSQFNAHLSTPSLLSSALLQKLHSPTLRSRIHRDALERVAEEYASVWARAGDDAQRSMRSVDEVRLLFGV